MQLTCLDIGSMARYVHRLSELEETMRIELHVGLCGPCRQRLLRMKRHSDSLFEELEPGRGTGPSCPSRLQLQHWARAALSERQMVRVQEHVRRCDACRAQVAGGGSAPGRIDRRLPAALLATRAPELDLRVAPEGIRIAAGAGLVDGSAVPALADRLGLAEPDGGFPAVTSSLEIHFRKPLPAGDLSGRIALTGLDGMRLELRWWGDEPIGLELWNRERIESRFLATPGAVASSRLLPSGHWFVGTSAHDAPWLAVAVEGDLLAAEDLAVCAYDRCRRGRFHSGLACLAKAAALDPSGGWARMHAEVERFARVFDLADDDHEIHWLRRRRPTASGPEAMDLSADLDRAVERVASLVLALQRSAERVATRSAVGDARVVSRRRFRSAFALLLQSLRARLAERRSEGL